SHFGSKGFQWCLTIPDVPKGHHSPTRDQNALPRWVKLGAMHFLVVPEFFGQCLWVCHFPELDSPSFPAIITVGKNSLLVSGESGTVDLTTMRKVGGLADRPQFGSAVFTPGDNMPTVAAEHGATHIEAMLKAGARVLRIPDLPQRCRPSAPC